MPILAMRSGNQEEYAYLGKIFGGGAVSIGRLYNADLEIIVETCIFDKLYDECCYQGSNFVAIQHLEVTALIEVVVHEAVCITIETASALTWLQDIHKVGWKFLHCLDIVSAACEVESSWCCC